MTPAPDDLTARLAERARQRWEDATQEVLAGDGPALDDDAVIEGALAQLDARDRRAKVVDLPARSGRGRWLGVAGAAAAAALLVWWMRPAVPTLPRYEAAFEGGIRSERGDAIDPGAPVVLLPSSRIRWSFTPTTATEAAVELRIEAVGPTRACIAPGGVRVSPTGALDVAGPAAEVLDLSAGRWQLTALLATTERFAALADPCARDSDGTRPDGVVELGRRAIEIRDAR
ncbi:MAG TPA: hypothetical protein VFG69_04275 [Nannocystaceae bacterium]|nr:hypothetical protein [Nannocystaceae bacterium]